MLSTTFFIAVRHSLESGNLTFSQNPAIAATPKKGPGHYASGSKLRAGCRTARSAGYLPFLTPHTGRVCTYLTWQAEGLSQGTAIITVDSLKGVFMATTEDTDRKALELIGWVIPQLLGTKSGIRKEDVIRALRTLGEGSDDWHTRTACKKAVRMMQRSH